MAAVTFGDAAAHLGHKSRGTLYRLKRDGWLSDYLRPGGKGGAELLELEPQGLASLREHVKGILRIRRDSPLWAADRVARPDPALQRWRVVADQLAAAAAAAGAPLQLGPQAAAAIAAALPDAMAEAWGDGGLEWLRVALVAAGSWWAGPPAPTEATAEHWRENGRWEPTAEPPEGDDLWRDVASIMGAQLIGLEGCTARQAISVWMITTEAVRDVRAGARWDQERWDRSEFEMYLEAEPGPDTAAWLLERLEAGRLPPDLAERARAWLATHAAAPEAA